MHVALLRGENFRLYHRFELELDPRLNVFVGPNAAGKTSVLEALFVAVRGRSFRAADLRKLCGPEAPRWRVFLRTEAAAGSQALGAGWEAGSLTVRVDGRDGVPLTEILRSVPLQIVDPLSHRMVDEGPAYRRSMIDWGVFHVEHHFLDVWRRYGRALRQRNAALRSGLSLRAIQAWDADLAEAGEQVDGMRRAHLRQIQDRFPDTCADLLGGSAATLEWSRGWPDGKSLAEVLAENVGAHVAAGTTAHGPHRAELRLLWLDRKARDRVSRGQQKMLVVALLLAQAGVLLDRGVPAPIMLVDDFASELGSGYQAALSRALLRYPGQKWVSAFEAPPDLLSAGARVFHVEHGTIQY